MAPATHGKGGFEAAPDSGASGDGAVAGAVPAPIGRTDFLAALKNRPRGIDIVLLQAGDILGLGEVDRFDAAHRLAHTALFRRPVFQRHWRTWRPELEDGLQLLADSLAIVGRIGSEMVVAPLCCCPRCGAVYHVDSAGRHDCERFAQRANRQERAASARSLYESEGGDGLRDHHEVHGSPQLGDEYARMVAVWAASLSLHGVDAQRWDLHLRALLRVVRDEYTDALHPGLEAQPLPGPVTEHLAYRHTLSGLRAERKHSANSATPSCRSTATTITWSNCPTRRRQQQRRL